MMKNNGLKIVCTVLGLWTVLLVTPTFAAAEDNDPNMPLSIDMNVLSGDSENTEILDVEVSDLLGIDNIDVKIPNIEGNAEEIASVSITDEEIGNMDTGVLTNIETAISNEQAVIDIAIEEVPIIEDVDVEVLKQEEDTSDHSVSNESAVVDVVVEELVVTEDVDVEVLKEEENTTTNSNASETALVDVALEDLIVTDDVDVEVLKEEESTTSNTNASESALVDVAVEDLVVTDDVDLEVLKEEENTTDNGSFSDKDVVKATVEDLIIADQLELNVFNDDELESNQEQMELYQGVHLNLNEIPLLETLHVGVLEDQSIDQSNSLQESSQLLTVGLGEEGSSPTNSLIDNVELNVLEHSQSWDDDSNAGQSATVSLELYDTNLGDLSANVLLSEFVNNDDNISNTSGLVELNTDDLVLLEDIHLGVLDRHDEVDGEESSISEGVLQLDILSDLTDEISLDILTNDEFSNNEGTYRNRQAVTIGLINDLVGEAIIDILPAESFAVTPSNPMTPVPGDNSDEVIIQDPENDEEEGALTGNNPLIPGTDDSINDEGMTNDNPVAQNDGNVEEENASEELTSSPAEKIIVADGEGSHSKDTMIENPTLTEDDESMTEEENVSGIGANFNNMDGNLFTGSSLPQTGGFFTGVMLLIIALSLLGSGWTIRKLA